MGPAAGMHECPLMMGGTELKVEDTSKGAVITLTTESGNVEELRQMAKKMAAMHEGKGLFTSTYEPIEKGLRLTLIPTSAAEVETLRAQVREHVEQMKKGECPMHEMMHGTMHAPEQNQDQNHDSHHPSGDVK
jgi:hypothetical protein